MQHHINQSSQGRLIKSLDLLIKYYQLSLSPDHGVFKGLFPHGVCRFQPTCSQYSRQSIGRFGLFGLWLSAKRVIRCHPFSPGGQDPVPDRDC